MLENWKDQEKILYHHKLLYVLEIMKHKVICRYYNDLLVSYFEIKKIRELVARMYF